MDASVGIGDKSCCDVLNRLDLPQGVNWYQFELYLHMPYLQFLLVFYFCILATVAIREENIVINRHIPKICIPVCTTTARWIRRVLSKRARKSLDGTLNTKPNTNPNQTPTLPYPLNLNVCTENIIINLHTRI